MFRSRAVLIFLCCLSTCIVLNAEVSASAEPNYREMREDDDSSRAVGGGFLRQDTEAKEYEYKLNFGFRGGGGTLGPEHDGFGLFGLIGGRYYPRMRMWGDIGLLYMPMNLSETSETVAGTSNEWELALELSGRYYFTPSHTFMGLHVDGGLRHGILFWRYAGIGRANGDSEEEVIHADAVGTVHIYAGLGISFMQTERLHLSSTLAVGLKFFYGNTLRQFENDLFEPQGFVQLFIDLTFMGPKSTTSSKPMGP